MAHIRIRRAHELSRARALAIANELAAQMTDEHGIECWWAGSTLHFRGSGLSGTVELAPKTLAIEIELGLLMSVFRDGIARAIERRLDAHLGGDTA